MRDNINSDFFEEYALASTISQNLYEKEKKRHIYLYLKRLLDILLSLFGIIITCPIIMLFIILIKIETKGPAFYFQERVGLNGTYFNVIKLRSMKIDAEKSGAQWAEKNDPRITKIGTFIRMTRIDELPQLINVVLGDMSLVGPRPERPIFTAQFNEEIPGFIERLKVKPGLTGWAQINGGYDITPKEKLELDLFYIKNQKLYLDIKILLGTFRIILTGNGAR